MDIKLYLAQYDVIKKELNMMLNLNDSDKIYQKDMVDSVKSCVETFKKMRTIVRNDLSEEEIKDINSKNDEIIDMIIEVKNKQIYHYNLKVEYINDKIKKIKRISSLVEEDDIKKIKLLKYCNDFISNNWTKNIKLDLDALNKTYDRLIDIENKFNVKDNEPIDLMVRVNHFEKIVDLMSKLIKDDMTLIEIDELLDKCLFVYDKMIALDLDVRNYQNSGISNKKDVSEYNSKNTQSINQVLSLIPQLLDKKDKTEGNSNDYTSMMGKLVCIEKQMTILDNYLSDYYGKSNGFDLDRFKLYSAKIKYAFNLLMKEKANLKLEKIQLHNIDDKVAILDEKMLSIDKKMNDPYMLGKNVDVYVEWLIDNLRNNLVSFESKVSKLEQSIVEKNKKEEITMLAESYKKDIENIKKIISNSDRYKFKNIVRELEEKYENTCKVYNSKCPLKVNKIKPANSLYKKYKKECLEISGLASSSLLEGVALIPTIMHGAIVLGQKHPKLSGLTNIITRVLGGVISAKRDEKGEWYLSNGVKIGPSVAYASVAKHMAVSEKKSVSLIDRFKKLIKKRESNEKKNKPSEIYKKIKDEVKEYIKLNDLSNDEFIKNLQVYNDSFYTQGKML